MNTAPHFEHVILSRSIRVISLGGIERRIRSKELEAKQRQRNLHPFFQGLGCKMLAVRVNCTPAPDRKDHLVILVDVQVTVMSEGGDCHLVAARDVETEFALSEINARLGEAIEDLQTITVLNLVDQLCRGDEDL